MRAMVLAAGLGSRLRPLTDERPKPAVPYGLRPLACVALDALAAFGVSEVVMNTHHLGERLPALLEPFVPAGMRVSFVHEPVLLGTGGALANVASRLVSGDEPVLVLNSDIVFSPDLGAAVALHRRLDAVATMVLRSDPDAARFGAVEVDGAGRVRRLLGEPASAAGPLSVRMFTGVHVLSARAFGDLPASGCIVRRSYRPWVDSGEVVAGVTDESPWRDLGTLPAYLDANVALAGEGALVHESASVHPRASLRGVVVGEGARVGPVRLERVVVWPGASVDVDLSDAIVSAGAGVTQVERG